MVVQIYTNSVSTMLLVSNEEYFVLFLVFCSCWLGWLEFCFWLLYGMVLVAMWASFLGLYRMYLPCVGGVIDVWFIKVSWIQQN